MKCKGEINAHEQTERDYRELVEASRSFVTDVWGRLPSGGKKHNLQSGSQAYSAEGRELEGHNVLSKSTDASIFSCVVYGWNPLSKSTRPKIRDSFVLGHNAVSGSGLVNSHLTAEEYTTFGELEPYIISRDPECVLRALHDFSKVVPDDKQEWINRWFRETRPDIETKYYSLIRGLYDDLPEEKRKGLEHVERNPKLVTAAHEIDSILHHLSFFGDAYHVDVENSVVVGWNAGNNIKGGLIKDCIFAGHNPLSGANVRVWNSYLVTPRGVRYIESEVLGSPQTYLVIPRSLQQRDLSLLDLHHVR